MIRKIKKFIQRGLYGYSSEDSWDLDSYLCGWLPDAIRTIKGNGYPNGLTQKEWDAKLELMARGFEAHHKGWETSKQMLKQQKIFKKGMKEFVDYFGNLWT